MCIVSTIIDSGKSVWPGWVQPYQPMVSQPYNNEPTPDQWREFMELVEKAKKFDEMTGQANCEDPEKVDWMLKMESRMAELEAKLAQPATDIDGATDSSAAQD